MTGKKISRDDRETRLAAAAVFFVSFLVYLATLPRTVSFEDSAEFVTSSAVLGIPHPSGYPLYVILGHLFTLLPFGTVPWRVALLSAVCASAALALAYLLAEGLARLAGARLGRAGRLAMVLVLLQPAFAEIWWSQAIYAKVYALHALLLVLTAWLLLGFAAGRGLGRLYAAALAFGLACSNHLFLALAAAPSFLLFAAAGPMPWKRPSVWLKLAGCWLLGLVPYVYLPLRSLSAPPYAMGRISGLSDLGCFVTRCRYDDVGLSAWNKFGLTTDIFRQLAWALGPLLLALIAFWIYRSVRSGSRRVLWFSAGCLAAVAAAPLALALRAMDWTAENSYMARVYALPGFAFAAILAAAGAAAVLGRLASRRSRVAAVALLGLLPILTLLSGLPRIQAYRDPLPETYGRAVLSSLPRNAVLAVNDYNFIQDTELFVLAYLQVVEKFRTDVTVVQDAGIEPFHEPRLPAGYAYSPLAVRRRVLLESVRRDPALAGRPVFATYAPEALGGGFRARSNGLVFELLPPGAAEPSAAAAALELPDEGLLRSQPVLGLLAAHVLYARAAALTEAGRTRDAADTLVSAIGLDTAPFSDDYTGFMAHRAAVNREMARPASGGVQ